jgi:predicted O-linked N-acetylglucosamine transferase (SPINDLY family)
MIRRDAIDILVDLSMHSGGNRLRILARKPAPVQVTHVGYPATTGLSQIDYRITDELIDPPGASEAFSSEVPVRLPGGFFLACVPFDTPVPGPPPALTRGRVTFACLNGSSKISSATIELFSRVMKRIEQSRILMVLPTTGNRRKERRALFEAQGIAAERIEFMPPCEMRLFLSAHQHADIALDPIPCNGGITTCNALLMGLPVISLAGDTTPSRAGRSILHRVGLDHLVTDNPDAYVETAVRLANDLNAVAALRAQLPARARQSTFMNAQNHTRELEAAYRAIWRKWCER